MDEFLQIAREYQEAFDDKLMSFISIKSGITPQALKLLLPSGVVDLLDLYFNSINSLLFLDPKYETIQSKVYSLVVQIFTHLEADQVFSRKLLNSSITLSRKTKLILRGARDIWNLVDVASDFSYYSRIASLSVIYGRSLLIFSQGQDWSVSLKNDFQQLGRVIKFKKQLFS